MGLMSNPSTSDSPTNWDALDKRVRRVDEDRWISSRYAPAKARKALIALYGLAYELARVRMVVSETGPGLIRFQWWRDSIAELEVGKPARAHDVCHALAEEIGTGQLKTAAMQKLVDGYEAAFQEEDRSLEPEGWLALNAANILAPMHRWGPHITEVAPFYAASRRSESKAFGPILPAAPKEIRPAIAHFRVRKHYCEGRDPNPVARRLTILQAIRTGKV